MRIYNVTKLNEKMFDDKIITFTFIQFWEFDYQTIGYVIPVKKKKNWNGKKKNRMSLRNDKTRTSDRIYLMEM